MARRMVAIDVAYSEDLGEHVKLWGPGGWNVEIRPGSR